MLVTMRPWTPRRRLDLATKCTICGSLSCDRASARDAKTTAENRWYAAVLNRANRDGLYLAMKAADGRYDQARALCFALHEENDRQMGIFIEAMKKTQAQRRAFDLAISEGVRQSMLPGRFGATMLCMRGAR